MTAEPRDNNTKGSDATLLIRTWRAINVPLSAIVLALLLGAFILWTSGANPWAAYAALYKGAFSSSEAVGRTLEKATPLILGGLAVAFAFKAGLLHIGGQGQLLCCAFLPVTLGIVLLVYRLSFICRWLCWPVVWPERSMQPLPVRCALTPVPMK